LISEKSTIVQAGKGPARMRVTGKKKKRKWGAWEELGDRTSTGIGLVEKKKIQLTEAGGWPERENNLWVLACRSEKGIGAKVQKKFSRGKAERRTLEKRVRWDEGDNASGLKGTYQKARKIKTGNQRRKLVVGPENPGNKEVDSHYSPKL